MKHWRYLNIYVYRCTLASCLHIYYICMLTICKLLRFAYLLIARLLVGLVLVCLRISVDTDWFNW